MERRSKEAVCRSLGSVVRQFTPSRLEHQLLAHVFEFVVSARFPGPLVTSNPAVDSQSNKEPQFTDAEALRGRTRSAA